MLSSWNKVIIIIIAKEDRLFERNLISTSLLINRIINYFAGILAILGLATPNWHDEVQTTTIDNVPKVRAHHGIWAKCSLIGFDTFDCGAHTETKGNNWAAAWQNQRNSMCAQRKLGSAWAAAQSDQSLLWVHRSFCWFCLATARMETVAQKIKTC